MMSLSSASQSNRKEMHMALPQRKYVTRKTRVQTNMLAKMLFKRAGREEWVTVEVKNLSMGGAFLKTKHMLPIGTYITIVIEASPIPIKSICDVRWIKKGGMGVQFRSLLPEDVKMLERVIAHKKRKGHTIWL